MNNSPLSIQVTVSDAHLTTTIEDRRPDVHAVFAPLPELERGALATDTWMVGLRAVMSAHRAAEESRLTDIGKSIVADVDVELRTAIERQQDAMVQSLKRYFDPKDGQVVTRIDAFLKDGGDLTRAMEKFLGPEHGALATTLARTLGENSPLLRRLSPTDSDGVCAVIEARVREALDANKSAITRALDPLAPDGAVARFLATLKRDLEKADGERTKQLALATKALDANDETSLLSRLVRETNAARGAVLEAMNPDAAGSPLAILKTSLTTMLERHAKSQNEIMEAFNERQKKLDVEIREVVARLEERKRGDATSPRGGRRFEDAVCLFTHNALPSAPVLIEDTGAVVGARNNCKVGDQVIRFTDESIYAGAGIVIEAKREANCTVAKALGELAIARANREAQAGVFVLAKSHAPPGFPGFARHGNDVLVVWDETDSFTDAYLQAALFVAVCLATRQKRGDDEGNIKALADVEQRVERELKRHDKMRDLTESIQKKAEEMLEELRKSDKGLAGILKDARATLKALNVDLASVEEERQSPVVLPAGAVAAARGALDAA